MFAMQHLNSFLTESYHHNPLLLGHTRQHRDFVELPINYGIPKEYSDYYLFTKFRINIQVLLRDILNGKCELSGITQSHHFLLSSSKF